MDTNKFIDDVVSLLHEWGVDVNLSPNEQVYTLGDNEGLACSGFFAELPQPRLAVATGKPFEEWLPILAHEFSHACQWKEKSPLWANLFEDWGQGKEEASDALDRWLEGEEWSGEKLDDIISRIRDIELDCEKRTLMLIEKYNLPIDPTEYAQKSNAYVYFYNHVAKTRLWYGRGTAPYQIDEVWRSAPSTLTADPQTPLELQEMFDKHYPATDLSQDNDLKRKTNFNF